MKRMTVLAGIAGLLVGAAGTFGGLTIADDSTQAPSNPTDRMSQMERSGEMNKMMQGHADMLKQMRGEMSDEMRRRMEGDEMSQMMMSGEMLEMMKEHEGAVSDDHGHAD